MAALPPLVAVVEDDFRTSKALSRVLRAGGFDSILYSSAEDYLASPPARPPTCLLLDVQLGGMSGLDLQRELNARGSTVPVVLMTEFDEERVREEALRIGCAGYLDKTADIDVLLELIKSF